MSSSYQQYYTNLIQSNPSPSVSVPFNIPQTFPLCSGHQVPQFFQSNLLSPNRVIKYVHGEYCVYRAFYFQLFKLMFQIQNDQKDYLEIVKEIVFDPMILEKGENSRAKRQGNNNMKNSEHNSQVSHSSSEQQTFKQQFYQHQLTLAHFIQLVVQNPKGFTSFQSYLPYFPQIDQSITIILQTFVQNSPQEMDSIQSILEYLCEIFEIELVVFDNCFKFEESDVFVYVEEKGDEVWVYVAYNEGEGEQGEEGSGISGSDRVEDGHQAEYAQENSLGHNHSSMYDNRPHEDQKLHLQQNQSNLMYPTPQKEMSSSLNDNVITSQMKPSSVMKPFNDIIHQQKDYDNANRYDFANRPNSHRQVRTQSYNVNEGSISKSMSKSHHSIEKKAQNNQISHSNQGIAQLPNQTSTKYRQLKYSSQQSSSNPTSLVKQSHFQSLTQNPQKQKNFHKKVRYFDQDQIIQHQPNNTSLTKLQSLTQPYNQTIPQHQSSFHVVDNQGSGSYRQISESKRISDSKADTIIDMFGDMLRSTANINQINHHEPHTSSSLSGFAISASSHNFNMQPQRDIQTPLTASKKKHATYSQAYGTANNIQTYSNKIQTHSNSNYPQQSNEVNMKKAKSENQIIFQAKPKGFVEASNDVFRNIQLHQERNQQRYQANQQKYSGNSKKDNLLDSQELRHDIGNDFTINLDNNQATKQSNNSITNLNYFQSIQARSYVQNSTSNHHSRSNSNHQSSTSQNQYPQINVNQIHSNSQTSSQQLKRRNNCYEDYFTVGVEGRTQKEKGDKQVQMGISRSEKNYGDNDKCMANGKREQRTQQQDDFFFHPGKTNKSSIQNSLVIGNSSRLNSYSHHLNTNNQLLRTIDQVRASRQTNKDSLKLNPPLTSNNDIRGSNVSNLMGSGSNKFISSASNTQNIFGLSQKPSMVSKVEKQLDDSTTNDGTFYKQFTSSKVLKLLKEPHRTKVQILRNRFKGQHRANIKKLNV